MRLEVLGLHNTLAHQTLPQAVEAQQLRESLRDLLHQAINPPPHSRARPLGVDPRMVHYLQQILRTRLLPTTQYRNHSSPHRTITSLQIHKCTLGSILQQQVLRLSLVCHRRALGNSDSHLHLGFHYLPWGHFNNDPETISLKAHNSKHNPKQPCPKRIVSPLPDLLHMSRMGAPV